MSDRLLAWKEAREIRDKIRKLSPEFSADREAEMCEATAKAQDAKTAEVVRAETLKELGEWLENEAGITFDQQSDSTIFDMGLEALKKGVMPE